MTVLLRLPTRALEGLPRVISLTNCAKPYLEGGLYASTCCSVLRGVVDSAVLDVT